MKILFITDKICNIYKEQMIQNLRAILGSEHEVVRYKADKKLMEQLKKENTVIVYMLIGGTEYNEITELYKDTKTILVSDIFDGLDIYINDEPEQVFPLLVNAIENEQALSTVSGITYKHKTEKAKKWDINQVVSSDDFSTFSTRGCKGSCSFCSIRDYQGPLRFREIPFIVDDIVQFSKYDGFQGDYSFSDPSFDSNPPERMKEILKTLIKEFPGYTYRANFRPDFHKMADDEMRDLLFQSGLAAAFVGVESGNEKDIKLYNKGTMVEDAQKTIELFKSIDSSVDIGFIMVNPFSDFDRLRQNVDFLKNNHLATLDVISGFLKLSDSDPIRKPIKEAGLLWPNSPYYEFQDQKTLQLMQTIRLIKDKLHQNALAQYQCLGTINVKSMKRQILFRDGEEKYNKIDEYDQRLNEIINRESDRLCEWLLNLLDLIEQGKPAIEYFTMTFDYITTEHMKSVVKSYTGIYKECARNMVKLDL